MNGMEQMQMNLMAGLPGMQNMQNMQNMQAAMFMNAMGMNAMNGMNGMNGMTPMNMSGCWNPMIGPPPQASAPSQPRVPGTDGARAKSAGPPPAIPPQRVNVIMTLPAETDERYRVEKDEEIINDLLDPDWSWFVQLVGKDPNAVVGSSHSLGVAIGAPQVAQMIGEVQVLFATPASGATGEELAIQAAFHGGRSYILSSLHELFTEVDVWRCAAILKSAKAFIPEPRSRKRGRRDGLSRTKVPSPSRPPKSKEPDPNAEDRKQFTKAVLNLGTTEGLKDSDSIPNFAKSLASRFLASLGANVIFQTLAEVFNKLEGRVGHRKALVYLAHELFTKRKKEIPFEDQKLCVEKFLVMIGPEIRAMKVKEREAYIELIGLWERRQVISPGDLKRLKDVWDMDEDVEID